MAGVMLLVAAIVGVWWLAPGGQRTVEELLSADASALGSVEDTAHLCPGGDGPACVEAWRTDVGDFLRFNSEGAAKHWAVLLGDDGRRVGRIVLDMRAYDLSFEERRMAIETLYQTEDFG